MSVGKWAFNMCAALTKFDLLQLPKLNKVSIAQSAFSVCKSLESFVLPKNVREVWIGKQAFENCTGLKTICLPELIELKSKYIGDFKMDLIDWSDAIKDRFVFIGERAFASCGVESVNISGKQVVVRKNAFSDCKTLKSVNIFSWDVKILEDVFSRCSKLQKVVFSIGKAPGVEVNIKDSAFSSCPKLKREGF